jgi:hypothetical protein
MMGLLRRKRRQPPKHTIDFSARQQFKAFLASPGRIYIVNLPGQRSTVMKVTDADEAFFRSFCAQLQAVLGAEFAVIPATPVQARPATTQDIAVQTAMARKQTRTTLWEPPEPNPFGSPIVYADPIRELVRQDCVDGPALDQADKLATTTLDQADKLATTTLDVITTGDDDESVMRRAALRIAAAQDRAAHAQAQLDDANQQLAQARDAGAQLHNRTVIEQAAQAIDDQP